MIRSRPPEPRRAPSFLSLLSVALSLLFASGASSQGPPPQLPENVYTLIEFTTNPPFPPFAVYAISVPGNSTGRLRITDLGCPGEGYTVSNAVEVLIQTTAVTERPNCDNPLGLDQAPEAYANPEYAHGEVVLPSGDNVVRITPIGPAGTAALGWFRVQQSSPTNSVGTEQPPTFTSGSLVSTITDTVTVPDQITTTSIITSTRTMTLPRTLTDGDILTTTEIVTTETIVETVTTAITMTATPSPVPTTITLVSTVFNTVTRVWETVVGDTTITNTAVETVTEEVTELSTTLVPAPTVTEQITNTVVETSVDFETTITTADAEETTTTQSFVVTGTVFVSDSGATTVPPPELPFFEESATSEKPTAVTVKETSETSDASTSTVPGSSSQELPTTTETITVSEPSTMEEATLEAPVTVTETLTPAEQTISITADCISTSSISADASVTQTIPVFTDATPFITVTETSETATVTSSASEARSTGFRTSSTRRRRTRTRKPTSVRATPTPTSTSGSAGLSRRFLESWIGRVVSPAKLSRRQENPTVTVTVTAPVPTATLTVCRVSDSVSSQSQLGTTETVTLSMSEEASAGKNPTNGIIPVSESVLSTTTGGEPVTVRETVIISVHEESAGSTSEERTTITVTSSPSLSKASVSVTAATMEEEPSIKEPATVTEDLSSTGGGQSAETITRTTTPAVELTSSARGSAETVMTKTVTVSRALQDVDVQTSVDGTAANEPVTVAESTTLPSAAEANESSTVTEIITLTSPGRSTLSIPSGVASNEPVTVTETTTLSSAADVTETTTASTFTAESSLSTPGSEQEGHTVTVVQTVQAAATTDVSLPVATCSDGSSYLSLLTSPRRTYTQAENACSSVGLTLAGPRKVPELVDATSLLERCNVDDAWVRAESVDVTNQPRCYAVNAEQLFEPDTCDNLAKAVLCSVPP